MIQSIIYVDLGQEAAPPQAFVDVAKLAGGLGASITLWDAPVDAGKHRRTPRPGRPKNRQGLHDIQVAAAVDRFATWRSCVERNARTESIVAEGRWTTEIAAELRNGSYDLVVVPGVGHKQVIRRIRHLVRTCEWPLLVVLRQLDAGVVAEVHADDPLQLNAQVIRTATTVAAAMRSTATFVCPTTTNADATHTETTRRRMSELVAECAEIGPGDVSVEVGRPVQLVNDRAVESDADLVVIGGSGRLGFKSRLTGNAAERLLAQASRSVLIIDPTAATHASAGRSNV